MGRGAWGLEDYVAKYGPSEGPRKFQENQKRLQRPSARVRSVPTGESAPNRSAGPSRKSAKDVGTAALAISVANKVVTSDAKIPFLNIPIGTSKLAEDRLDPLEIGLWADAVTDYKTVLKWLQSTGKIVPHTKLLMAACITMVPRMQRRGVQFPPEVENFIAQYVGEQIRETSRRAESESDAVPVESGATRFGAGDDGVGEVGDLSETSQLASALPDIEEQSGPDEVSGRAGSEESGRDARPQQQPVGAAS